MERTGRRNRTVIALILYGVVVLALTCVGLWRQALLLGQFWRLGDPGIWLDRAPDGRGYRVAAVAPHSPAERVLKVGDRVLHLGDLSDWLPPRYFWRDQGRPVLPDQVVPVSFERGGAPKNAELPFQRGPVMEKQLGPGYGSFERFLLGEFLPAQLTLWGCLIISWVVLLRRSRSRDAQLCFLLLTTAVLTFSYRFGEPSLYPMPLRWLYEHDEVVDAWIGALAVHFVLVMPEERALYRRLGRRLLVLIYFPPVAITGLALLATLRPASQPAWLWLKQNFYLCYALPALLLFGPGMLQSAALASTAAGRRQARTILLGNLPWLLIMFYRHFVPFQPNPAAIMALFAVAVLVGVGSLAYAILRQGLLDLGLIVRQGLVYGMVLAALVAGYYLLVVAGGQFLLSVTGQQSPTATMVGTLALVMLLRPVTFYARRWVDRAFYRDRLETTRRLQVMIQETLLLLDRDAILTQLTSALPAIFPARGATLFLLDPTDGLYRQVGVHGNRLALSPEESLLLRRLHHTGRPVSSYVPEEEAAAGALSSSDRDIARQLEGVLWLPLLLRGRLIGTLALGWKASEEIYTEEQQEALCLIANEASVALENAALSAEREKQARLQQEVAIGRAIQRRLLAPPRLRFDGFEILSRSEPAADVGGDFYNLFHLAGGSHDPRSGSAAPVRLGILLGDVAGKGVPAALFMAVTTTLVQAQAELLPSPAATLAAANTQLYPKMRPPGEAEPLFATAVYGVLDGAQRVLRLANAGQIPPIYWPAAGPPRYLRMKGVPLGAMPASRYKEEVLRLSPGDRLLFCSDGFIEDRDCRGQAVGYEGFLRRLEGLEERIGAELIEALFDEGDTSRPGPDDPIGADDRTLVLITMPVC